MKKMRISSTDSLDGDRVVYPIGKIKAASAWHGAPSDAHRDNWREMALRELIQRAEDVDADAIIDVNYEMDRIVPAEQTGVSLRRILATGVAVKLAVARSEPNEDETNALEHSAEILRSTLAKYAGRNSEMGKAV